MTTFNPDRRARSSRLQRCKSRRASGEALREPFGIHSPVVEGHGRYHYQSWDGGVQEDGRYLGKDVPAVAAWASFLHGALPAPARAARITGRLRHGGAHLLTCPRGVGAQWIG